MLTGGLLITSVCALVAILLGVVAYLMLTRPCQVEVKPNPVVVKQYDSINVGVTVQRRTWARGQWRDIPGAFLIRSLTSEIFAVRPDRGGTREGALTFTFSLTGTTPGVATLRISGTPAHTTIARIAEVTVEVVENPDDKRRIRQSSAALKASIRPL